tara:strand:- start:200 stop:676 length:477 start_codon:yes stop_codon:yes gene_type:complete
MKNFFLFFCITCNLGLSAQEEKSLFGYWLTSESIVEIKECDKQLCANIVQLLVEEGVDPKSILDKNNADSALRSRPLIGVNLLNGFMPILDRNNSIKGGKIYNPRDGKFYKSKIKLLDNGYLRVEGCLLLFCDGEEWLPLIVTVNEDGTRSAVIKNKP